MTALFCDQFERARRQGGQPAARRARRVSIATGTAAEPFIGRLAARAAHDNPRLECAVFAVENAFFGSGVNVSGLVTGRDLLARLKGCELGDELLIPANMLRSERDMFLDNITIEDVERALKARVVPVETDGLEFFKALRGEVNV
jgi:NifB/MoaA-like Fe-S oxidoreductase